MNCELLDEVSAKDWGELYRIHTDADTKVVTVVQLSNKSVVKTYTSGRVKFIQQYVDIFCDDGSKQAAAIRLGVPENLIEKTIKELDYDIYTQRLIAVRRGRINNVDWQDPVQTKPVVYKILGQIATSAHSLALEKIASIKLLNEMWKDDALSGKRGVKNVMLMPIGADFSVIEGDFINAQEQMRVETEKAAELVLNGEK